MQTISEDNILGFFFFILAVLFGIMTYLVLRKGKSEINITFSLATIAFMLGSLLCSLDFFAKAGTLPLFSGFEILGNIGTLLYLWAPFGIFLASKLILHGTDSYKEIVPIAVFVFLIGVTFIFVFTSDILGITPIVTGTTPSKGTWFGTIVISVVLIVSLYYYFKIYQKSPDLRNQLSFLIGGIILGIFSLASVLLSTNDPDLLPMEFDAIFLSMINIGILISSFAFTNIPDNLRTPGIKSTNLS